MRGTPAGTRRLDGGPIAFDGAIDNRADLHALLQHPATAALDPDDDGLLILELVSRFGTEAVQHIAGQFACGVWDRARLLLVRDRIGSAPLYFTLVSDRPIFATAYRRPLAMSTAPPRPHR